MHIEENTIESFKNKDHSDKKKTSYGRYSLNWIIQRVSKKPNLESCVLSVTDGHKAGLGNAPTLNKTQLRKPR